MRDEATYTCQSCGEPIVIPVDRSAGREQEFVEDCPVCCRPHLLRVTFHDDGEGELEPSIHAELE